MVVSTHTLALFALASMALVMVPGPNLVYITARSIAEGRRAGVASALGVETGTLVHIGIAAACLSYVIASSAVVFNAVKYAGAAYLVYLGIRTLRSRDEPFDLDADRSSRHRLGKVYRDGVVVNVLNPKVIVFFLAFLPQFVDREAGAIPAQIVVLGLVLLAIGVVIDMVYAIGAGSLGDWLRSRPSFARYQRYVSGVVYLGLAVAAVAGPTRRV